MSNGLVLKVDAKDIIALEHDQTVECNSTILSLEACSGKAVACVAVEDVKKPHTHYESKWQKSGLKKTDKKLSITK